MRKRSLRLVFPVLLAAGTLVAAASPASASNGFQKDEYGVWESAGHVKLTVQVKFVPMGQGQIDYHTSDLTAIAGHDFQQTSGTVTFVSGTYGVQDIEIPINQDELIEGEEQFEVKLTNFRGSFVDRGYETALVRIFDDDEKPLPSGSSSPGTSTQKTSASKAGSAAGSSASSTFPGTTGATGADNESGEVIPNEASFEAEVGQRDESEQTAAKSLKDDIRGWGPYLVALRASLVAALIVGGGFVLKKRLRRRAP